MGATLRDLFGDGSQNEPATPGSYGIVPPAFRLPDATYIRGVTLQVSNLAISREFYQHVLGLQPLSVSDTTVALGVQGSSVPLVTLVENSRAPSPSGRKRLGLYHFAILLPTRADLGRFVRHLSDIGARAGAGDHLVSEAFYLQDPDDLGIEVYADRPRDTWLRRGRELTMGTDSVDVRSLVAEAGGTAWTGMPAGTVMGHVHLHVGDITTASRFYADAVGFDKMVWSYPGALFLAAGGYHHHLGNNVWAGPDATAASADEPQLLEWTLVVPSTTDVSAAAESVRAAGFAAEGDGSSVLTRDPWGTPLRIATHVE